MYGERAQSSINQSCSKRMSRLGRTYRGSWALLSKRSVSNGVSPFGIMCSKQQGGGKNCGRPSSWHMMFWQYWTVETPRKHHRWTQELWSRWLYACYEQRDTYRGPLSAVTVFQWVIFWKCRNQGWMDLSKYQQVGYVLVGSYDDEASDNGWKKKVAKFRKTACMSSDLKCTVLASNAAVRTTSNDLSLTAERTLPWNWTKQLDRKWFALTSQLIILLYFKQQWESSTPWEPIREGTGRDVSSVLADDKRYSSLCGTEIGKYSFVISAVFYNRAAFPIVPKRTPVSSWDSDIIYTLGGLAGQRPDQSDLWRPPHFLQSSNPWPSRFFRKHSTGLSAGPLESRSWTTYLSPLCTCTVARHLASIERKRRHLWRVWYKKEKGKRGK